VALTYERFIAWLEEVAPVVPGLGVVAAMTRKYPAVDLLVRDVFDASFLAVAETKLRNPAVQAAWIPRGIPIPTEFLPPVKAKVGLAEAKRLVMAAIPVWLESERAAAAGLR